MFEILARQEPYKNMSVLDVGPKIRDEGMAPDDSVIDSKVPQELRDIMKSCWNLDPDLRPVSFTIAYKVVLKRLLFSLTTYLVIHRYLHELRRTQKEFQFGR